MDDLRGFEVETKYGPLNLETVVAAYKKTGIVPDEYDFKRCALGVFIEQHAPEEKQIGRTASGRLLANGNDRAAYVLGMANEEEARQVTLWFFTAVEFVREELEDV